MHAPPPPVAPTAHVGETINGMLIPDQLHITHGRGTGALAATMQIYLIEFSPERTVAVMPVEGNTQPLGLLHGGANCVLGESLGSMSAYAHATTISPEHYAVGIDINATHTASATSGWVTGECTAISLGRSVTVHEIVIRDADDRRCSTVRITNLIRKLNG